MVVAQPPVGVELAITLRPELVKLLLKVRDLGDRVLQSGVRHGPQVPGAFKSSTSIGSMASFQNF